MSFEKIARDIRSLKIQGAENIAKASVMAVKDIISKSKSATKYKLIEELKKARNLLFKTRPTEPCMRNAINYILTNLEVKDIISLKALLDERIKKAQWHFEQTDKKIAEIGSRKIKNGMIIFTHCHSSSVMAILKEAKKQGKKFQVYNTETRPKFQGRLTALELSRLKIPVTLFIDSAARLALKKSDLFLFGADAITSEGKIINKIGTELFAEVSNRYDIPTYSCTDSWKFDPKTIQGIEEKIEKRSKKEVWPNPPPGVEIVNPAFERVKSDLITGIISELGIYRPQLFIETLKETYPFIFQ